MTDRLHDPDDPRFEPARWEEVLFMADQGHVCSCWHTLLGRLEVDPACRLHGREAA